MDIRRRINEIDNRLDRLPKGTLTYKNIKGKLQPYIQRNIEGKSVSYYIKVDERERILIEFDEKAKLTEEKKRLQKYMESLASILERNPYLDRQAGIGWQSFADLIDRGMMYVDKTDFLIRWWENTPQISLITRPRRFGKTLMMSMIYHFFDPRFSKEWTRFADLAVWKKEKYRKLYGSIPVIMLCFASIKSKTFEDAMELLKDEIRIAYDKYSFLENSERLDADTRRLFAAKKSKLFSVGEKEDAAAIRFLSECIYKHFGKKPIILLDEYDTPIIEAYAAGYYDEMMDFYRTFFNLTFKNNDNLFRAIITGINKISKNSLYSDMNNICVYTMLSDGYGDCFGFTESEVHDILKCQDIDLMNNVKNYYDGFSIGSTKDMYNPWSICNFVYTGTFDSYWINTGSNILIRELMREYPNRKKCDLEKLIQGEVLDKTVNEDLAIQYIKGDEASFWSLMVAVGYVKAERIEDIDKNIAAVKRYRLSVTNLETMNMLEQQSLYVFPDESEYNVEFAEALINGEINRLNILLEDIMLSAVSYFDTGKSGGGHNPAENFYHGLVLGLIVALKNRYYITSNRESGRGRYDISMIPKNRDGEAFIIEFKIRNHQTESGLKDTIANAFKQINDNQYEKGIIAQGIEAQNIKKMVFAFDGKESLVADYYSLSSME